MTTKLFEPHKPRIPIIAWSLYDFADTSFVALIITIAFPIYIKEILGGTEFQIGLAMGLSLAVAALIVPFIGALSDALGRRIPILAISTIITVILTALTGYVGLIAALILGALANLFNTIDVDLYDSFIPDLAPPETHGRLSGFGVAIGYLGTIVSLALAFIIFSVFGFESSTGIRALFVAVAAFFLVFSLPLFFFVKDKSRARLPLRGAIPKAYSEMRYTLTNIRDIKGLGSFLSASFIYNDAMHTVIIFLSLYGTQEIGLSLKQFLGAFAVMSVAAFLGSLIFGKMSDSKKPKKILTVILILWIFVVGALIFAKNLPLFLIVSSLGGALLGGVWVCNRHMVTLISPPHKIAEIFGFEGLTEKVAGVIGPVGFGFIVTSYGYASGLLYLTLFLIIGLFILVRYVPDSY